MTTGDIAAASSVKQGAVFKHFQTKDAIWIGAMKWVRAELLAALEVAAQAAPTARQALGAVFHAPVAFANAHPGVPRFNLHELRQAAEAAAEQELRALMQACRKLLLRLFGAALLAGLLPPGVSAEAVAEPLARRCGARPGGGDAAAIAPGRSPRNSPVGSSGGCRSRGRWPTSPR